MGHGLLDVGQRGGGARAALAVSAERAAEVREGGRRDHEPRQAEERVDLLRVRVRVRVRVIHEPVASPPVEPHHEGGHPGEG